MDKSHPPESFGVFKPVGHIVIAYRSASAMEADASALREQGFAVVDLVRYTPSEMMAQIDAEIPRASPLAAFGQELNLIKAHRLLAQEGCSFLVVHAPDDEQVQLVTAVVRASGAPTAQRYGRFVIEELTDHTPGEAAGVDMPTRGLAGVQS